MARVTCGQPTLHILAGRLAAAACDDVRNDCLHLARSRLQRAAAIIDDILAAEQELSSLEADVEDVERIYASRDAVAAREGVDLYAERDYANTTVILPDDAY